MPRGDQGPAQPAARIVQSLVDRAARRFQPLGENVNRHIVDRRGLEDQALPLGEHFTDQAPRLTARSSTIMKVLQAWAHADPQFQPRRDSIMIATRRLQALRE